MATDKRTTPLDSFVDSSAPICYGILKPGKHFPGGIPVIKVKNISKGKIHHDELLKTTPEIHEQYKRAEVIKGDLLLTIRGTSGRVAMVPESLNGANITQDTARVRVSSDDEPLYVFYALQSPEVQRQIELNTVGQAVKGINIAEVKKLKIYHPEGGIQKKIAKILATWDKAIATTEKLIETSKQQKKALMQQLLTGKKRFAGFVGEWERHSLSDLVYIDKKSLGKKIPSDFSFRYISLSDVATGNIAEKLETHTFAIAPSRARRMVQAGDILLSTVRPNLQGFAKVSERHSECIASTGFSVLSPKKNVCGDFIYQYIFSSHITGQINSLVVGSNYPAINSSDVAGLKIYCPSYQEQQKVASVLSAADAKINKLLTKLTHLKQEKKALMQQLLTGKRKIETN